ncbi:uncharacterized protein LOC122813722, partial [Protopterus annectens]|uniref:uncharacterized protein LOC122813722 n=1 Tax=Protopterus annectens TaxID=7888 RepID=UPI001CF961CD
MVLCNTKDERETENTTSREEEMTKKKMEQKGVKAKQFFKKVANKMKKKTKSILDGDLQKPDKQEGSTFYFRSALKDAEVDEGLLQDDDRSSEEGLDTDGNISDSDACMEFEPVNPFHVWQVGYWKAEVLKIFNAEKSFRCVILVKDAKNPEIMNWKIKKDLCEFVDLQKNLSKTYPDLQQYDFVSITQQLESQNEPEDSELTEKIKSILNEFLEK